MREMYNVTTNRKGCFNMKTNIKDETYEQYSLSGDSSPADYRHYIIHALYAFAGFCFSQLDALGEISPFTLSFLSAVKFDFCFPVFIFSCLGYFLSKPWQIALKYSLSSALMCLIRLFITRKLYDKDSPKLRYIICLVCSLSVGLIFTAFSEFNYVRVFMVLSESLLSLCASLFFIRSFKTPVWKTGLASLSIKDSSSLVLSVCVFIMCMSGFSIEGLSPARIISCLALMFLSFYKGSAVGSLVGICIGASLCITPSFRYLFPCYALSGLVSGLISPLGQIATALAFAVTYSLAGLFQTADSEILISLIEVAIASAAFMIMPASWISSLGDTLKKSGVITDNPLYRQVSENLCHAAENIYEVSDIVCKVSEKLDSIINPEVNKLFANLQQGVCVGCEKKALCWNKMFDSTASDILALSGIEKRSKGKLPLEKRCERKDLLLSEIQSCCVSYANNMAVKMKAREMRKVLTDQFCSMGDFLKETAQKISDSKTMDTAKSTALRSALQDAGIYTDSLSYFTDSDGRVRIEIGIIDRPFETDRKKLRHIIEFLLKRRFSEADITVGDVKTTIAFEEKYLYDVVFGYAQRPLDKKGLCGDAVGFVSGTSGLRTAIISDGMGTGARAAIDSTMTSSVVEKLISGGFSVEGAIRSVNSAMIMKSTDESIATVDAVSINLYTAQADFYKSGAAVSFIRRGNEIHIIKEESLPVGIIRNISPAHRSVELSPGDIILLVSDGVTGDDCGWINDELLSWSTNNMQDLASHIVSLAHLRNNKNGGDDLTAAAIKIRKI